MTDQAGYDRLLWSCDLNLVRGRLLRAGPVGRAPLPVAHLPQDDEAHIAKLDDFLDHYLATLPADAAGGCAMPATPSTMARRSANSGPDGRSMPHTGSSMREPGHRSCSPRGSRHEVGEILESRI